MKTLQLHTPPLRSAFEGILAKVDQFLTDYRIESGSPIVLGLSGGKDSTLAMLALRELGADVRPAIIDLGYEHFSADAIRQYANQHGFNAYCIRGNCGPIYQLLPSRSKQVHDRDLLFLASPGDVTPCGACSMSKRRLLGAYAEKIDSRFVVLAHHRTDALVTILKDYFLEEFFQRFQSYERERFRSFISRHPLDLDRLQELVDAEKAGTLAFRTSLTRSVEIVRPLVFVDERDIAYVVAEAQLKTFGSGCSHSFFISGNDYKATKRELVHAAFIDRFADDNHLCSALVEIAATSIDEYGRQRFNPRKNREIGNSDTRS